MAAATEIDGAGPGRRGTEKRQLLLSPLTVGPLQVANRVVSTAHGAFLNFFSTTNSGEQYIAYQQARAAGGCGMIINQAMHVHPSSAQESYHRMPREDDMRSKFGRLARAVQPYNTVLVQQLFHMGAMATSEFTDEPLPRWSFSGAVTPEGEPSHMMTTDEIEEVIEAFVHWAVLAVESGLHGVELHGTHGYLLQQSFSPWGNQRTDEWGDPLRFATVLLDRVRNALGREHIVGLRISADDFRSAKEGGLGPDGLRAVAAALTGTGKVDYLNHSEGSQAADYAQAIGNYRHPHGEFLPLTKGLRDACDANIPVIGVGRLVTPDVAEKALQDGVCDLVGMTRAQLVDPELVNKLRTGRAREIRPCVGANVCIDGLRMPVRCFHAPEAGEEHRVNMRKPISRRVLVVGGGPAGMKAAETAARAGHRVTLLERSDLLGGRLRAVSGMRGPDELMGAISWLEGAIERLGVEVITGRDICGRDLSTYEPDVILLATGARPVRELGVEVDGSVPVITVDEAAFGATSHGPLQLAGRSIVLVDCTGTNDVFNIGEHLSYVGHLTIVTQANEIGSWVGFTQKDAVLSSLRKNGAALLARHELVEVANGKVTVRSLEDDEPRTLDCDVLVAGLHPVPDVNLLEDAKAVTGAEVHVIGDAVAPRGVTVAMRDGHRIAGRIGVAGAGV